MQGYWGKMTSDIKQHIYLQPYGYPIRLCNWQIPDGEEEEIGQAEYCKLCKLGLEGKRVVCFAPKEIEIGK